MVSRALSILVYPASCISLFLIVPQFIGFIAALGRAIDIGFVWYSGYVARVTSLQSLDAVEVATMVSIAVALFVFGVACCIANSTPPRKEGVDDKV